MFKFVELSNKTTLKGYFCLKKKLNLVTSFMKLNKTMSEGVKCCFKIFIHARQPTSE